jgi:hypothetical protein
MVSATLKTVRMYDPAVDESIDGDQLAEFAKTRDMQKLRFIPGKDPVFYHVGLIDASLFTDYVQAAETETERFRRAFQCGVERVDNFRAQTGEHFTSWQPSGTQRTADGSHRMMDRKELAMFAPADQLEIGSVAYWRCFLPHDIGPYFRVPQSSVVAWGALASLRADSTQAAAAPSSDAPKEPPAAAVKAPNGSDDNGAKPTAATASTTLHEQA